MAISRYTIDFLLDTHQSPHSSVQRMPVIPSEFGIGAV